MSLKQQHREFLNMPLIDDGNLEHAENTIRQAKDKTNFLILPSLFREFETQEGATQSAMEGILPILKEIDYIDHVVIGLDAADEAEYSKVLDIIKKQGLPQNIHVLWNNSPDIEKWRKGLAAQEVDGRKLAPSKPGKGRNVWGCVGYINALMQEENIDPSMANIAMHDCDITTYDKLMVARLFQPLCMKYRDGKYAPIEYVKAYFKRYTTPESANENGTAQAKKGILNARVTRLFGPPFIDTIQNVLQDMKGYNEGLRKLLEFMRSLNYMLSGEMAFTGSLLNKIELPNDYSLEVRILEQAHKFLPTELGDTPRIADIEVAERYDHNHQGIDDLKKMVTQIAAATFEIVESKFPLTHEIVKTIKENYLLRATGVAKTFNLVADSAGLKTDLQKELDTAESFAEMIPEAYEQLKNGNVEKPSHSWNVIMDKAPDAPAKLLSIVSTLGGQIRPPAEDLIAKARATVPDEQDNGPTSMLPVPRERNFN